MCVNTCLAYTGPFAPLTACPFCGEHQYKQHHDIDPKIPHYHLQCTAIFLAQCHTNNGIQDYNNVCCGSEYLDLVESGHICDNDMLLILSMDESDTWFSITTLIDFAPEIHHVKEMVLPTFVIGGLNTPKHHDSFLFPMFAHLSIAKNLASTTCPWFCFGTVDTVGMAKLNGLVGHHCRNRC
ncbi:hypothetical protein L208DRAFT_1422470 [Tricholoma matsutake]|nr:hypothetical protein L208DRAFT_1422470 [Tricholoma matsutake 945]